MYDTKKKPGFCNTWKTSSVCKNNSKVKIYKQAVQPLSRLEEDSKDFLFSGNFEVKIQIYGKAKGDIDNYTKAVLDSLQGIAYENDRNCKRSTTEFC